ncbi:hypothetical protein KBB96_09460 [Luteolibacter ambystomatis]|uniref:PDZ domain-containing protein n=1 Tax=Luteolibacter ambystomatis TaxID=2824561 RepID=A0A975J366_9BACT|nr:hypothetical protein [Luteolibacter ambystomatis]QUE53106.1 hypothetical protein KBB96_09460 [Luteolibacter ambystomatis]
MHLFIRSILAVWLGVVGISFAESNFTESRFLYENRIPDGPAVLFGEISIDGKAHPLMVDVGAEAVLIADSSIAAQYGAPMEETRIKYSNFKGWKYSIPAATVGGLKFPASVFPAYDLTSIRNSLGTGPFCILGWEALKGKSLELDHDAGRFRIFEGPGDPPAGWITLPMTFEHNLPNIHATLAGKEESWQIDTGFNDTIMVSQANFERLVADGFIRERNPGAVTRIGETRTMRTGYFNKGKLLGVDLAGLSVTTEPRDYDVLGMTFFRKMNLLISIEPSRFSYTLRKNPVPPISETIMMGIIFTYDKGQGVIERIRPGSNAEKLGLKPGDRVERIDELGDVPLDAFKMFDLCRKYAEKPVTLRIKRDGQPLTVPLPLTALVDSWNRSPVPAK